MTALLARLRARLAARSDSEHEQAIVRLVIGLLVGLYLLPEMLERRAAELKEPHFLVWSAFLLLSAAIVAAIVAFPRASPLRRVLGTVLDAATLSWCIAYFEEKGVPLFLVYLWVTFGNGFRYGARYLVVSLVLSTIGFATAMAASDYWRERLEVGAGLLVAFAALSLYVLTLVRRLSNALERAEAANQAKRRFISVVSHEMRTPLNAILGMADLLRDTPLNREQADMLQTLRASARVMLGLVDDVLDFSKIEAGKLALEHTDFDLHALVNSTCRILATQAAAKGVDFVVSIMPEVPPLVRGDPHHLRHVLINLAGNAVKFTERGSVTVHLGVQRETETHVQLKFSVRDTGIGIPPEAQDRIFDSFTQADQSTTRRFGGTGLGTTIAKQLVELMGGRIGLESAVGLGSTFWFELELEKQPERAASGAGELAGARVMLVGFPAQHAQALEQALRSWGAVPVAVADVEEAANRIVAEISLAQPYHSVLVYTDEAGLHRVQRLRRMVPEPAPALVLAFERSGAVPRAEALAAGFGALLECPIDKRQLFHVLHAAHAGEEPRDGVVRLRDYARRAPGVVGLKVLVADDNPTNREVLGRILERAGHVATLVPDGERALGALEAARYDVAIVDRNMPGMSGPELVKAIRLTSAAHLPVVVLSADVTPEAKQESLDAGADAFLGKPVEAAKLLDQIQALCAARVAPPRAAEPAPPAAEAPAGAAPVINPQTLRDLEELGSSPAFLDKLIGVFNADNAALLGRLEAALAARNASEFRNHLHAMKGSAASIGAERLTALCRDIGRLSDAEIKLRAPALLKSLREELATTRAALDAFLRERRSSAI
ncbi:MAG: ATP-binding protein [Burkholderiales bacterium]|nr:ATP-binding protein [Burkholderiales bacterium]